VSYYLIALWCFDLTRETFVIEFVLIYLYPSILTSDYNSAYSALLSFLWLLPLCAAP